MRQLGRCQVVHPDEDLSIYAVEVSNDDQFHEKTVRYIWSECQYLSANTRVCDLSRGEVSPAYLVWHRRKSTARDEPERPTKRPHLQDFVESSQEQWGWLVKEENYMAEIGKLKQQIRDREFENDVQVAADKGEKNKLAQQNKALRARIRQERKNVGDQQKNRSNERLIAELRSQINKSREDLERSEACIARMWVRWAKCTMARRKHLQQVIRDSEISIGLLRETNSTLQERIFKQARDAQTDRRRCYDVMARMEKQMERFQDRLADNAQALRLKNRQIEQLFRERDNIRSRIDDIGHYIYMRCLACEQMPRDTLLTSVMGYVHRIMNELKSLQRGLTPKPAERPNDASRAPELKSLIYP
ncbi:uncharacterized protein [Nicotiana sylvestris]|uniref:uncharacterized protein n=1 Tax=Nicotiana sylvestris TaxID=4096 RepID=UPI00388CCF3F